MRRNTWLLVVMMLSATVVAGTRHHDRQLGFSLDLPSQWTVAEVKVPGIARFHGEGCSPGESPARCREYVVVIRATAQEGETSEAAYRRRMRPWKMLTEGRIKVDGETVPWGMMDYGSGAPGDPVMRLFTAVVVRDGRLFEFTGWSRPESSSKAEPVFEEMARSLTFPRP